MDARDKLGDPSIVPARGSRHTLPRRSAQARRAGLCQQPSLQPQRLVRGSVQRDFLPVQRLCPFAVVLLCPLIILSVPLLTLGLYQFPFNGVPQNHDIHLCVFTFSLRQPHTSVTQDLQDAVGAPSLPAGLLRLHVRW